jgi:endoglucanase
MDKGVNVMSSKTMRNILIELDNTAGVSGRERAVGLTLQEFLNGYCDEFTEDPLGNFIFRKRGDGPKILLAAHMDELGFMVSFIEENGMVRMVPAGWHDDRMVVDQDVLIHTRRGALQGVTGSKPAHILTDEETSQAIPMKDIYVDIGTKSRAESEALGARIGDAISFDREGHFLNGTDVYTGKSIDNRSGCTVMAEVMRRIAEEGGAHADIYAAGTVQEELGFRGAGAVANRVRPDYALILDGSLAGGSPDIPENRLPIKLGEGAAVTVYNWWDDGPWGNSVPQSIVDGMVGVAEANSIPYQLDVTMGTATDGYPIAMSGQGVLTGGISVPTRYVHTAVGILDFRDVCAAADLAVAWIRSLA